MMLIAATDFWAFEYVVLAPINHVEIHFQALQKCGPCAAQVVWGPLAIFSGVQDQAVVIATTFDTTFFELRLAIPHQFRYRFDVNMTVFRPAGKAITCTPGQGVQCPELCQCER